MNEKIVRRKRKKNLSSKYQPWVDARKREEENRQQAGAGYSE